MEWMWNAVMAWFGWNIAAPFLFLLVLLAVLFIFALIKGRA